MTLTINHQLESIKASTGVLSLGDNSGGLVLPTGGTASRPAGTNGVIRFNTDSSAIELYNGTSWTSFNGGVSGPISSTTNAIPVWGNSSGNLLNNSGILITGGNSLTGVNAITGTTANFTNGSFATGTVGTLAVTAALTTPTLGSADSSTNAATTAFVQNLLASFLPAGIIWPYGGTAAPTGFLLCYGQSLGTGAYPNLFAAIGYNFGGAGANFNAPDLRGRVIAGIDNMGGVSASRLTATTINNPNAMGGTGGFETITLSTSQMPAHTHPVTDPGHLHGNGAQYTGISVLGGPNGIQSGGNTAAAVTNISIGTAGAGAAHPNVQPTAMLHYIIKY